MKLFVRFADIHCAADLALATKVYTLLDEAMLCPVMAEPENMLRSVRKNAPQ